MSALHCQGMNFLKCSDARRPFGKFLKHRHVVHTPLVMVLHLKAQLGSAPNTLLTIALMTVVKFSDTCQIANSNRKGKVKASNLAQHLMQSLHKTC